jgi:ankyrin repeat protein
MPLYVLFRYISTYLPIDMAAVSILLAHSASPNNADYNRNTPLYLTVLHLECIDAISCLLENGGNPSQWNLK